ncbi:MAG: ATP-binding protein [Kofleriaceae bacterium]
MSATLRTTRRHEVAPRGPEHILTEIETRHYSVTDRMFLLLLLAQWVAAVCLGAISTPWRTDSIGGHALWTGALIDALPILLVTLRPGRAVTRHAVAVAQILWSAELSYVTGGHFETYFHLFGSLAILALYRDWKVLATATATAVIEHSVLMMTSGYAVVWWGVLGGAAWLIVEDVLLVATCVRAHHEMEDAATREATLEQTAQTVRRKVENRTEALRRSSERYQSLVENTEAIMFEYDIAASRFRYLSPQAQKVFGAGLETLLGGLIPHDRDRARVTDAIDAFVRGERGASEPFDYRLVSQKLVVHVRTFFSGHSGTRVQGMMLDITRQTSLEAELRQTQKLESVGRLAAGVAHEINTPIQFVSDSLSFAAEAVADLMTLVTAQDEALAATGNESALQHAREAAERADLAYLREELPAAIARTRQGADRIAKIVRSMNAFAQPNHDVPVLTDLRSSVESTLMIAAGEYKYIADVELHCEEIPRVRCFAGELNQAILNIVINASHAIADAVQGTSKRGKISIDVRQRDADVVIAIADTGRGIPEHVRPHIFEQFFTTKDIGKGTGQGLSLARTIVVDKHHGSIRFETEVGAGTTFFLRIPIEPPKSELTFAA